MNEAGEKKTGYVYSVFWSFITLFRSIDHIHVKNIRLSHCQYMLIFPLAPVFANMQGALFPAEIRLAGLDPMTLMGSAYCLGAGVLFIFTKPGNISFVSRISAVITVTGFFPWILMGANEQSLPLAILCTFGLGGCAACAAFAYTFTLNNTERFFGAATISLFFVFMQIDAGLSLLSRYFDKLYFSALVVGTVICMMLYEKKDFGDLPEKNKQPQASSLNPALKLTLYFFVAHYLVEIFYTYLPGAASPQAKLCNGLVGVFVVVLAVVLQAVAKRSVWHMCNLFFVAIICTYALYFTSEGSIGRDLARLFHGFEQMGYIAAYYLLGCGFKKHGDFRLFKLCLVVILPASMLTYVIPGLLSAYAPSLLPLVATGVSGAVFMVFVLLSPAYARHLFSAAWSDDFRRLDVRKQEREAKSQERIQDSLQERMAPFNLSPREKEIAGFLLQGLTAKQIALELGISLNTANFHIKNLYRKLGIGGKTELFSRFGTRFAEKTEEAE